MTRRRLLVGGLLVTAVGLALGHSKGDPPAECNAEVGSAGTSLRARVAAAYAAHLAAVDRSGPNGTDVTPDVSDLLPMGIKFDPAEAILRCAGFEVHARPGPSAPTLRTDRFDVYAVANSMLPQDLIGSRQVIALLRPDSPVSYDHVTRVAVIIVVTFL